MQLFLTTLIYFASLLHGYDVQEFRNPQKIFWKVCTRCEYVGLINSKPYWHHTKKESSPNLSKPNYQKLQTTVKRCMDQKIRARNFEARNERIGTGVLVQTRKWKQVSFERKQGECYKWKAKEDSAQKELLAVSATMRTSVEK